MNIWSHQCCLPTKVHKRVLEALCSLNNLLHSSQASLIAIFTHTARADCVRMSIVASESLNYCLYMAQNRVNYSLKKDTYTIYTYMYICIIY